MPGVLVLSGGASRRMGRDKAWLSVQGVPLLRHVVEQALAACERVVVVAAPGQSLPELPAGVERIEDPPALHGRGPLVGVIAGLEWLLAHGVAQTLLTSCDAVALRPAHVHFMLAQLDARPAALGVVPCEGEQLHPLAAVLRSAPALARARMLLDAGELRLRAWADAFERVPADALPDPRVLLPCNTPAQWQALVDQALA
jgi:molybdopterin-guanine dinucleotide biosynthesis protein A